MEWLLRRIFEVRLLFRPAGTPVAAVSATGGDLAKRLRSHMRGGVLVPRGTNMTNNNNMSDSKSNSTKVLTEQEFAVFTMCAIFDAHYLPWFKRCYTPTHRATFDNRLANLINNLQLMFSRHTHRKQVLLELAMRRSFRLKRKLQLSIESVDGGHLELYPMKIGVAFRSSGQLIASTYNLGAEIPIQPNYELQIDIPLELNDTDTRVDINFYFVESGEQFHTVKECDISGFAGYSHDFAIHDYGQQEFNFRLNLRWELDQEALFAQIEQPEIIVDHFSGALLAAGTYYFRFYLGLFSQLLLHKATQHKALQSFREVSFVTGSMYRSKLCPVVLALMQGHKTHSEEVERKSCTITYHLFHAALLLLNTVSATQQGRLLRRLQSAPFDHILRLECWTSRTDAHLPLHRLLIRRLYQSMQKYDDVGQLSESVMGPIVFRLMVDASRKPELDQLLNESVLLFIKYFKLLRGGRGVSADGGEMAAEGKLGFGDELSHSSESTSAYHLESSDNESDLVGRILTEHFAELVTEERVFAHEYIECTANLIARLTKEFRRHQLFSPSSGLEQSPPERELTITLTSSTP